MPSANTRAKPLAVPRTDSSANFLLFWLQPSSLPPLCLHTHTHTHPTAPLPRQQLQSCATPNYSQQCQAGGATAVTEDGSRVQSMATAAAAGGQRRKGQITVHVITVIYLKSGRRQSVLCLCSFLPSVTTEQFLKTLYRDVMHLLSIVLSTENHRSQSK